VHSRLIVESMRRLGKREGRRKIFEGGVVRRKRSEARWIFRSSQGLILIKKDAIGGGRGIKKR